MAIQCHAQKNIEEEYTYYSTLHYFPSPIQEPLRARPVESRDKHGEHCELRGCAHGVGGGDGERRAHRSLQCDLMKDGVRGGRGESRLAK